MQVHALPSLPACRVGTAPGLRMPRMRVHREHLPPLRPSASLLLAGVRQRGKGKRAPRSGSQVSEHRSWPADERPAPGSLA